MATETLSGSGTWNKPVGASNLVIECWGGGGAGGGNATSTDGGGGGGGGAYAKKTIASPAASYDYVVGAGGAGVSGADGNNGGDTTFGSPSVCTAKGGVGGKAPVGGAGGVAGSGGLASGGVGDSGFDGGWGTTGRDSVTGRGGGGASSAGTAADGANDGVAGDYATYTMIGRTGPTGSGPGGDGGTADTNGSAPASGNGGGGGASGDDAGAGARIGGAGANGKIVLTWDILELINKTPEDNNGPNFNILLTAALALCFSFGVSNATNTIDEVSAVSIAPIEYSFGTDGGGNYTDEPNYLLTAPVEAQAIADQGSNFDDGVTPTLSLLQDFSSSFLPTEGFAYSLPVTVATPIGVPISEDYGSVIDDSTRRWLQHPAAFWDSVAYQLNEMGGATPIPEDFGTALILTDELTTNLIGVQTASFGSALALDDGVSYLIKGIIESNFSSTWALDDTVASLLRGFLLETFGDSFLPTEDLACILSGKIEAPFGTALTLDDLISKVLTEALFVTVEDSVLWSEGIDTLQPSFADFGSAWTTDDTVAYQLLEPGGVTPINVDISEDQGSNCIDAPRRWLQHPAALWDGLLVLEPILASFSDSLPTDDLLNADLLAPSIFSTPFDILDLQDEVSYLPLAGTATPSDSIGIADAELDIIGVYDVGSDISDALGLDAAVEVLGSSSLQVSDSFIPTEDFNPFKVYLVDIVDSAIPEDFVSQFTSLLYVIEDTQGANWNDLVTRLINYVVVQIPVVCTDEFTLADSVTYELRGLYAPQISDQLGVLDQGAALVPIFANPEDSTSFSDSVTTKFSSSITVDISSDVSANLDDSVLVRGRTEFLLTDVVSLTDNVNFVIQVISPEYIVLSYSISDSATPTDNLVGLFPRPFAFSVENSFRDNVEAIQTIGIPAYSGNTNIIIGATQVGTQGPSIGGM